MSTNQMHVQGPQIHQFNNIAQEKFPRSAFKRDFTRRTTFNTNDLVPIFLDEILPGDDLSIKMTAQVRMTTPLKPLMDNLYFETFWFFVPNRLVWIHWENFQGQQANPSDSVAYTIPVLDATKTPLAPGDGGFTYNSVYDHFGLPTGVTSVGSGDSMSVINCLFNRAYDLIWNEWFRDENLQNSLTIQTGDGPDDPGTYALRQRNKRKDYITGCLPWPQKGTAVSVNLGSQAIVKSFTGSTANPLVRFVSSDNLVTPKDTLTSAASGGFLTENTNNLGVYLDPNGRLYADLTTATPITINALRQAALYQQILELDARGGTRYVEAVYSRFGVLPLDMRLQRPELVGQGQSMVNVYAVPQTQATGASGTTTPQGNLAAFSATPITQGHSAKYSATEHGMLIGLANVRADLTYQQNLPRMFSRRVRLDYYEPLLNGLGEQGVLNSEVMAQGTTADQGIFGYMERFSEYRYKDSQIVGAFRAGYSLTLDVWHLAQQFGSLPALNSSFITEAVPMDRVLAVATANSPNFLADISYSYNHVRVMPIRSNPGIDRL